MVSQTDLSEFTEEVRDFLSDKLTPELRHFGDAYASYGLPRSVAEEWTGILDEKGWSVPEWPVEYGGTGWSVEQVVTFKRELTLARAPRLMVQGVDYVGPVVIEFGSEEQKAQTLPRIRRGQDWWEGGRGGGGGGAGGRWGGERGGGGESGKGTKIWTTYAHQCNKIFCLVRTSDGTKPQAGITFLMFDLDLSGIEVRPILTFGGDHEFNQVFFSDVRVPKTALLGEENNGWTVAKYLLVGERAHSYAAAIHVCLERTREFAGQAHTPSATPLLDYPEFREKLAAIEVELASLDASEQKVFELLKKDLASAAALSSVTKIQGSELQQRMTELAVETLGSYAVPEQPMLLGPGLLGNLIGEPTAHTGVAVSQYFFDRAITIASGTTEVQKNVIATRVLGL
ncbi:MAG: acyl-CoA dehydrogenase family protein [Gammaproteobacteria bacterium]|nr:acyl-CoA dehydrogenase family protein [Gammaproteobacteria bacterium]